MSAGGHILDMVLRIKYNESMRWSSKARYKRVKDVHNKLIHKKNFLKETKQMSPAVFNKFRQRFKKELLFSRLNLYWQELLLWVWRLGLFTFCFGL